jgi:hypothetical protein
VGGGWARYEKQELEIYENKQKESKQKRQKESEQQSERERIERTATGTNRFCNSHPSAVGTPRLREVERGLVWYT